MPTEMPMEIRRIDIASLLPHPKNANVMSPEVMKKLRRHIARTGRYEPLVVRPHPAIPDAFELINGHHRKAVLAALGHAAANCVVWDLDDAEALMLLATINRLGGQDAAGKRLGLLDALAAQKQLAEAELAALLPEDEATLKKLLATAPQPIASAPRLPDMPEAFTVFLSAADKQRLVAALKKTHGNAASALMMWADAQVGVSA